MTGGDPTGPIFPRICTPAFRESCLKVAGMNEDNMPFIEDLAGDLCLGYGMDVGSKFIFVTNGLAKRRGLTRVDLRRAAIDNLVFAAEKLSVKRVGPAFQVEIPNDLSAASYFLDAFWADMRRQLKAWPACVFAHRNFVAFAPADDEKALEFLRFAAKKASATDNHGLSSQIFVWRQGWTTLDERSHDKSKRGFEQDLDACFPDRDDKAFLKFPCRFVCPSCAAETDLPRAALEGALQARQRGLARPTHLRPDEADVFIGVERQYTREPERFISDLRCMKCDAAAVIGLEFERGMIAGTRFRPLYVWGVA